MRRGRLPGVAGIEGVANAFAGLVLRADADADDRVGTESGGDDASGVAERGGAEEPSGGE